MNGRGLCVERVRWQGGWVTVNFYFTPDCPATLFEPESGGEIEIASVKGSWVAPFEELTENQLDEITLLVEAAMAEREAEAAIGRWEVRHG